MMALTRRRARARRVRRTRRVVDLYALMVLVIGVAVVGMFPAGPVHALDAAGAFQRHADHRGAELR